MKILVVVDMQNDFVDGALGTEEAVGIVPAVAEKIRNFEGRVLYTRDTHESDYMDTQEGKKLPVPHCIRGTKGWEICPQIEALCSETVISNVLVVKAFLPETEFIVDASCCAGVTPQSHRQALEAMKVCQVSIVNE